VLLPEDTLLDVKVHGSLDSNGSPSSNPRSLRPLVAAFNPRFLHATENKSPARMGLTRFLIAKGEAMSSHLGIATRHRVFAIVIIALLAFAPFAYSQANINAGSISGAVTDPSGATLPNVPVIITNNNTGRVINLNTTSSGNYTTGPIDPGTYTVKVTAKGFQTVSLPLTVQVGNTANGNVRLVLGQETQVVEVQAETEQVNTQQATVQGVLNAQQIENLPVNGRNFLDLAQLEPGVQIQDGQNFDPTKAGYSSISFGGRFGRTARINVDGIDVSDETVGTTTQDIPASAIQEFQLAQSNLDISTDLTSSGAVNVVTKSGTNALHGEGYGTFRDSSQAAALPTQGFAPPPFQRSQFGGNLGGPIIKDKLFFFLDAERTKQDSIAPVVVSDVTDSAGNLIPFSANSGTFSQPFRETETLGRLDYQLGKAKLFYRFTYFQNSLPATFGFGFSVYDNKDITRNHVFGVDFATGNWSHSIRYSYLKFQNQIVDQTTGTNLPFANLGIEMRILPTGFLSGPNLLAPQSTPQANNEAKYDGIKSFGKHTFRFGMSYNRIQGGGFAKFFSIAPRVSATANGATVDLAKAGPFPGGATNPLNYPAQNVTMSNGQGFSTENPALGFPAGGLGPDNRIGLYFGDVWKIFPNMTVTAGLRYDRDTGRTDSDLPAIPEINAVLPGFGNAVKNPNLNFAPQLGIALDPTGSGKSVFRAGIGVFYENVIYNNVLFDRPLRLRNGAFLQTPAACLGGKPQNVSVTDANGNTSTIAPPAGVCGEPMGLAAPALAAFQQQFQALTPFNLNAPNPNFVQNSLAAGLSLPVGLFAPNYKSPRSIQMNVGFQHEIRRGMIASVDLVRNVTEHLLLGVDENHIGDARFFDANAATNAITLTNAQFGCPPGSAGVNCAIGAGATIADYAGHGLTSPLDPGGSCVPNLVPDPTTGVAVPCAFPGINPSQGALMFLEPVGRSSYNALQMKVSQNVTRPLPGLRAVNFQVSYSLSRFTNPGGTSFSYTNGSLGGVTGDNDQDFVLQAADNNSPNRFSGPSLLDRTHQFSFGGYVDTPGGFRLGMIGHFYSPLAQTLFVPDVGTGGGIFQTDFTGDGTIQDPVPGTNMGAFDRHVDAAGLNAFINNYNATVAGQPTPAGQVLINSGLMTVAQLQALGAVAPTIALAPQGQVNLDWLRSLDMRLAWRHTFKERFTVEPSVAFFNVLNFANFNLPPNTLSGILSGGPGSLNGTTYNQNNITRVGNGTGVYNVGAPRQIEWGLKFTF
jgi:Carboxypeptidase regulatory-like domain